jgi:hypothetical protein
MPIMGHMGQVLRASVANTMSDWTHRGLEIPLPTRVLEEVIEEEDGAFGSLIVTFLDHKMARFVGVAIDRSDDQCTRWLEAPVQDAEWESARRGMTSLRDLFRKAEVHVVNRRRDLTPVRAWKIAADMLRPDQLPDEDATLEVETPSDEPSETTVLPKTMCQTGMV